MDNQSMKSPEKDVVKSKPSLNAKIPKNFLMIGYFTLFLSIPIWGMTVITENFTQKLFLCFIGSLVFSMFLFFDYIAHFLYLYWEQEKMLKKLRNPLMVTFLQIYYLISSLIIAWISYKVSGGEFPQLLFYLVILFLPVFLGKGSVRIHRIRDFFVRMSSNEISG